MRILLVEDEEKVSRFVSRGLTAGRFAVDMARDGNSGWELAQTYQYDLIILKAAAATSLRASHCNRDS